MAFKEICITYIFCKIPNNYSEYIALDLVMKYFKQYRLIWNVHIYIYIYIWWVRTYIELYGKTKEVNAKNKTKNKKRQLNILVVWIRFCGLFRRSTQLIYWAIFFLTLSLLIGGMYYVYFACSGPSFNNTYFLF